MPTVYSLSCTDCDYAKLFGFIQVPFMVLDNGQRKNIPHPGEDLATKHQTGLSVRQLQKLGRIGRRNAFTCERCLEFQLFADDEVVDSCAACGHTTVLCLSELVGKRESHLKCAKCRTGSLVLAATGRS